jgi:hypothetical protein
MVFASARFIAEPSRTTINRWIFKILGTITMNKTYLIVLSSLIACSSWGMERVHQPLSLLETAAKAVAKNVDLAVRNDVQLLKEQNLCTEENVRKNILNEIALLEMPDDSIAAEAVIKAYRKLYTDQKEHEEWMPVEYKDGPWMFRMNGYHDKIAVLCQNAKEYKIPRLYLYTPSETGWKKEQLGAMIVGHPYAACWGKDDELILLGEKAIHILPTPNKEGFDRRYRLPYEFKRGCFYQYHKDLKILAIEQRLHPGTEDKSADVALLHIKDNALQVKHIIPCGRPISSIYMGISGINKDDGEIVEVWSEGGKRFTQWKEVDGVYKYLTENFNPNRSCDGIPRMFMGNLYLEHSSEISYVHSQRNCLVIQRALIPIYAIPKKILQSLKDASDQAEPVDDILKEVL